MPERSGRQRTATKSQGARVTSPRREPGQVTPAGAFLLHLQRSAGNAAATVFVQRWDVGVVAENPLYSELPSKMRHILPHQRAARLKKFADTTDSPEQLLRFLELADADQLERLLPMGSANLAALATIAPSAPMFQKLASDCLRLRIHASKALEADPELTPQGLQKQIDAAQAAANVAAGLVSANGDAIAWQPAASVVGDGRKDEQAAVAAALTALDGGTLGSHAYNNNEGSLPGIKRGGGYRTYDVAPPPGTHGPGRRRLVVSNAKGFVYYTWNHYGNDGTTLPAFKRIR